MTVAGQVRGKSRGRLEQRGIPGLLMKGCEEEEPALRPSSGAARNSATAVAGGPATHQKSASRRQALPGWAIDLIRDGVPTAELRKHGQRAVWNALGRTALAAVNAGHSRVDWEYEVLHPTSNLGQQNRLRAHGRARGDRAATKALYSAWERAERRAADRPCWTTESAQEAAVRRAEALRLVAGDPEANLPDAQRTLLLYAAEKAVRHGSVSVNLPRASTARDTGLGEKSVRLNLAKLSEAGLLRLTERGRPRTQNRPGLANAYQLPGETDLRFACLLLRADDTEAVGHAAEPDSSSDRDRAWIPEVGTRPSAACNQQTAPSRHGTGSAKGEARAQVAESLLRLADALLARHT